MPASIVINQKRFGGNARSTVGTATDIYALLRLLYSRFGTPFVGYSDVFSFNNPQGMCPDCEGLGKTKTILVDRLIDKEKSLNEGAILFPTFRPGEVRWKRYVCTGLFDNDKKLKLFTEEEMDTLLYKAGFKPPNPTEGWPPTSFYEGVVPRIKRTFLHKDSSRDAERYKEVIDRIYPVDPRTAGTDGYGCDRQAAYPSDRDRARVFKPEPRIIQPVGRRTAAGQACVRTGRQRQCVRAG
ncbi:hypothetical protein ACFFK0_22900 [Paenibacillus chartarius]|uniref:UvrA DNA-binding domain-containing protein n=1 Tax=Paenibacillus chartarius TaxID=747481 RepID=A0ABV6DRI6_9BACL